MDMGALDLDVMHHPTTFLACEALIMLSVFAFVRPSSLRLRLVGLGLILVCAYHVVLYAPVRLRTAWAAFTGGAACFWALHYFDVGILRRHECAAGLKSTRDAPWDETSITGRLRCGFLRAARMRKVDTPLEVKGVSPFTGGVVPTRGELARATATSAVLAFVLLDLASLPDPPDFTKSSQLAPKDRAIQRVAGFLSQWVLTYAYIGGMYDFGALLFVGLNLSEPRAWRPIFGPLAEAFTLRAFWGSVWHQLGRDGWGRPADSIAHRVLGLPRGSRSWLVMHVKVMLVFTMSGVLHVITDLAAGVRLTDTTSLRFFVLQGVGVVLEDYVRLFFGDEKVADVPRHWSRSARSVGYLWVTTWLFWTTPYWTAGMMTQFDGKSILPFSVFKLVLNMLT